MPANSRWDLMQRLIG